MSSADPAARTAPSGRRGSGPGNISMPYMLRSSGVISIIAEAFFGGITRSVAGVANFFHQGRLKAGGRVAVEETRGFTGHAEGMPRVARDHEKVAGSRRLDFVPDQEGNLTVVDGFVGPRVFMRPCARVPPRSLLHHGEATARVLGFRENDPQGIWRPIGRGGVDVMNE